MTFFSAERLVNGAHVWRELQDRYIFASGIGAPRPSRTSSSASTLKSSSNTSR